MACVNAALVEYLEEKRRSGEIPMHMDHALRKAVESIRGHSFVLSSGKEAQHLPCVGPWVARQIDRFVAERRPGSSEAPSEESLPDALEYSRAVADGPTSSNHDGPRVPRGRGARRGRGRGRAGETRSDGAENDNGLADRHAAQNLEADNASELPRARQPPRRPRAYNPKLGSAPFALLVGLFIEEQRDPEVATQGLTKAELIPLAQNFADEPIIKAPPAGGFQGGQHYFDGWSCMNKTLVGKGLVEFINKRPKRFWLTESGRELATNLYRRYQRSNAQVVTEFAPSQHSIQGPEEPHTEELAVGTAGPVPRGHATSNEPQTADEDAVDKSFRVIRRVVAVFGVSEDAAFEAVDPFLDDRSLSEDDLFRVVAAIWSRATAPDLLQEEGTCGDGGRTYNSTRSAHLQGCRVPEMTRTRDLQRPKRRRTNDDPVPHEDGEVEAQLSTATCSQDDETRESQAVIPGFWESRRQLAGAPEPLATRCPESQRTAHPTCEIVLIVDNREIFGAGSARQEMAMRLLDSYDHSPSLIENKVLETGDALFIARPLGRNDSLCDVVLDFLVERKTMADLAQSIHDNRYRKQKYFMKRSGIPNLIYLVEGIPESQNNFTAKQIRQVLAKTAISDGFVVQQCKNMDETMAFLRGLHRRLEDRFTHTPWDDVRRGRSAFLHWNEAQRDARKGCSIEDIFGAQLMCVRGISHVRADAILKTSKIRCAADLRRRFQECETSSDKDTMLLRLCSDGTNSKVNEAISKRVSDLFNFESYDEAD